MGFGFDDRIYLTFTQLVTTFYKSLFSTQLSRLVTTLLFQLNCQSKAEQSRAVAYCRQAASTVTLGIEPR
jgi:hypothetical protein